MNLTTLNVAGIASIILVFASSACITAAIIVAGGSTAYICGAVGWLLAVAFSMTGIVLQKLGLKRSLYYTIAQSAGIVFAVVAIISVLVRSYQDDDYVFLAIYTAVIFIVSLRYYFRTFNAGPASPGQNLDTNTQDQEPAMVCCCNIYWIVFAIAVDALILSLLSALPVDEAASVSPLNAAICIILALLVVSTWIFASTPMIAHGMTEPLAPEEQDNPDSANTMSHDVEMA